MALTSKIRTRRTTPDCRCTAGSTEEAWGWSLCPLHVHLAAPVGTWELVADESTLTSVDVVRVVMARPWWRLRGPYKRVVFRLVQS